MPKLPDKTALGGLSSARSGRDVLSANEIGQGGAEIAKGMGDLGKSVALAGELDLQRANEAEDYETQKRLIDFRRSTEQDYEEYKRAIEPGGNGFQKTWDQFYTTKASDFFGPKGANIPERHRPKVDLALVQIGEGMSTHAQKYELAERDRYHVADIQDQVGQLARDVEVRPGRLPDAIGEARALIDRAPIEGRLKATLHKQAPSLLEKTARQAMVLGATTAEDFKNAEDTLFVTAPIKPERAQKGDAGKLFKGPDAPKSVDPTVDPGIRALGSPEGGPLSTIIPRKDGLATVRMPSGPEFHVSEKYADRFRGAIDDLVAAGIDIKGEQSGGYNNRNIRGTSTPSKHASGEAIDVNWSENAQGTDGKIDPTIARSVAAKWGLKWGGDFKGFGRRDPMHFEVDPDVEWKAPKLQVADASTSPAVSGARLPSRGYGYDGEDAPIASARGVGVPGEGARLPDKNLRWAKEESGEEVYAGPFQNSSLSDRIATYKQLEAKRKQLVGSVEQEIKTYEDSASQGILPPEGYLANLKEKVEQIGDPQTKAYFDSVMGLADLTSKLNKGRPADLEGLIRAERAQNTDANGVLRLTPVAAKRLAHLDKLNDTMKAQVNSDPLEWAHKVGLVQVQPIDFDKPETLAARAETARQVAAYYGQEPQFFTKVERDALTDTMRVGGDKMLSLLGQINRSFGPDTPLAIKEFAKDAPEAAWISGMMIDASKNGGANTQAMKDAALGIELRRDKNYKKLIHDNEEHRSAAVNALGTTLQALPHSRAAALATADLVYEARALRKGITTFDSALWTDGLNEVLGQSEAKGEKYGGTYYQRGGLFGIGKGDPVIVPPNVKQRDFRSLVDTIRHEDLIGAFGEAPVTGSGTPLSMGALRQATLVTVGSGQYWMAMGDPQGGDPMWVKDHRGQNYTLDINALEPVLRKRRPDLYLGSK